MINWKKVAAVVIFILVSLTFGFLLYYFFLRPTPTPLTNISNGNQNTNGNLPVAGGNVNIPVNGNTNGSLGNVNEGLGPIPATSTPSTSGGGVETVARSTGRIQSPTLASNGSDAIFYDRNTGLFYRLTPQGAMTPLDTKAFREVSNVTWSPNRNQAILEFPDGSNILYSFETKRQVTLPAHWKDFNFSPNGDNIVFKSMGTDPENRWLAVADADGSRAVKIENLGREDASVITSWAPTDRVIAMHLEDKDFDRQNLFFIGRNNENYKLTTLEGRDFRGQWSPDGGKMLYSVYTTTNNLKPSLWIMDASGQNIGDKRLNLKLDTWADRCSFANEDTVYCAVPQNLSRAAGLFANDLDNSPSDIYKIDLTSGFTTKIATPAGNHNISNIMATADGQTLYFVSKNDGKLYQINLQR